MPEYSKDIEDVRLRAEQAEELLRVAHETSNRSEAERARAVQRTEQAEAERDRAYRERAHLVALLAAMTSHAVIAPAPDVEERGWQIVYLVIGDRQASWHISPRDADLFAAVEHVDQDDPRAQWDGHTTDEKYAWIAAHTAELMARCGPECAEMHRGGYRCAAGRT